MATVLSTPREPPKPLRRSPRLSGTGTNAPAPVLEASPLSPSRQSPRAQITNRQGMGMALVKIVGLGKHSFAMDELTEEADKIALEHNGYLGPQRDLYRKKALQTQAYAIPIESENGIRVRFSDKGIQRYQETLARLNPQWDARTTARFVEKEVFPSVEAVWEMLQGLELERDEWMRIAKSHGVDDTDFADSSEATQFIVDDPENPFDTDCTSAQSSTRYESSNPGYDPESEEEVNWEEIQAQLDESNRKIAELDEASRLKDAQLAKARSEVEALKEKVAAQQSEIDKGREKQCLLHQVAAAFISTTMFTSIDLQKTCDERVETKARLAEMEAKAKELEEAAEADRKELQAVIDNQKLMLAAQDRKIAAQDKVIAYKDKKLTTFRAHARLIADDPSDDDATVDVGV
ncbi:hypothetical protein BD410DRAFT_789187 [Rickenella mellea]|uniref:Uncharacterized protein n=1 Tax=Rickenella mellea TaxID=50990 RepID=A0A4Y7Q3K2_9AGAM|nr:hypothetical protein BD410DRAFT_789187 [Rickenella mellea]